MIPSANRRRSPTSNAVARAVSTTRRNRRSRPCGGFALACSLSFSTALLALGAARAGQVPQGVSVTPAGAIEAWNPALLRQAGLDPDRLHCNPRVSWAPGLRGQAAETADQILGQLPAGALPAAADRQRFRAAVSESVFWRLVRVTIVDGDHHNAGVLPLRGFQWRDGSGGSRPLLIFRSAITRIDPDNPSCVGSLLREGGVRHVVNLYDSDRLPVGPLLQREEQLARSCQASYLTPQDANARYGSWRERLRRDPPGSPGHARAMSDLARLIREQILSPGGRPPRGNIYLHCGGGMHRSGMVMGILDRCVNGTSMEQVQRLYLRHSGWQSARQPGGAEQGNLEVIAGFDCSSLGPLPGAVTEGEAP